MSLRAWIGLRPALLVAALLASSVQVASAQGTGGSFGGGSFGSGASSGGGSGASTSSGSSTSSDDDRDDDWDDSGGFDYDFSDPATRRYAYTVCAIALGALVLGGLFVLAGDPIFERLRAARLKIWLWRRQGRVVSIHRLVDEIFGGRDAGYQEAGRLVGRGLRPPEDGPTSDLFRVEGARAAGSGDPVEPTFRPDYHLVGYSVRMVAVALDWEARPAIHEALTALAEGRDASRWDGKYVRGRRRHLEEAMSHESLSPEAREERARELAELDDEQRLVRLYRATHALLLEHEASWLAAEARHVGPLREESAHELFRRWVGHARSRYQHEVVRGGPSGTSRREAPPLRPREEDGPGVVVVQVIAIVDVRHRSDLELTAPTVVDPETLRALLRRRAEISKDDLRFLEVVWSPAADEDRMSTAELEVVYPTLVPLDPERRIGRRTCGHCGGIFAAELERCHRCGAPAATRA